MTYIQTVMDGLRTDLKRHKNSWEQIAKVSGLTTKTLYNVMEADSNPTVKTVEMLQCAVDALDVKAARKIAKAELKLKGNGK